MKLFKKSLAALLALTMALSSMAASMAFAAEGDEVVEEGPVTAKEYTAQSAYLKNYDRTPALDDGWYGDNGFAATEEEAGANAVPVKYTDADRLNNYNEVLWGVEMGKLAVKNYTLVFKFALVAPETVENENAIVTALAPVVRNDIEGNGDSIYDPVTLEYYTVADLREKMENAKAKGEQFIEISVPITVENFGTAPAGDRIKIECRLSSNKRATELLYGDGIMLDDGIGLAIYSLRLDEGTVVRDGLDADGYYWVDGELAINQMVGNTANGFYYTDENGKIRKNYASADGYYFGADGKRVSNVIAGGYYYGADGKKPTAQVGVKFVSGRTYFILAGGKVATNTTVGGKYYDANGVMVVGKIVNGKGYDATGNQIKNKVAKVGGKLYAFDASGNLIKGKKNVKVGSGRTATNADGSVTANKKYGSYITGANGYLVKDGVKKIGKTTYAVKSYKVVTGTKIAKIGKKSYAVKKGKVVTGKKQVVKIGKKSYAVKKTGQLYGKKQVVKIGKKSYAVKKTGQLYGKTKKLKIGKKTYTVAKNGVAKIKK